MISASTIRELSSKISTEILVFGSYILIYDHSGTWTYIDDCCTIDDYVINMTIEQMKWTPGYQFKCFSNDDNIKEHGLPLAKKWASEYRIAEIISYNEPTKKDIYICDNCIMFDPPYGGRFCITNDLIYEICGSSTWKSTMTLYGSNLIGHLCNVKKVKVEHMGLSQAIVHIMQYIPKVTTIEDIYVAIINARARGLHVTTSFSDISIDHYEN